MMVLRDGMDNIIFPADKCSWTEDATYTGDGYRINNGIFYPGASVSGILGLAAASTHVTIQEPQLGFIGKSGRFVAISVEH